MIKHIEKEGRCDYHWGSSTKVRLCRLRHTFRDVWSASLWLCSGCRDNLRGFYKYVRPKEEE